MKQGSQGKAQKTSRRRKEARPGEKEIKKGGPRQLKETNQLSLCQAGDWLLPSGCHLSTPTPYQERIIKQSY